MYLSIILHPALITCTELEFFYFGSDPVIIKSQTGYVVRTK